MGRAIFSVLVVLMLCRTAAAQFKEASDDKKGARLGESVTTRWQSGLLITAEGVPCRGLVGTAPVPVEWPEQQVTVAEEDIPPSTQLSYQMDGAVKMMVVKIPGIPAGQQVRAVVTTEVRRSALRPPADTRIYRMPESRRLPRDVRPYLAASPMIESRNPKLKGLARQAMSGKETAWAKVEALYDYAREKVTQKNGRVKGAILALKEGEGNHEDITGLFIALCRASDVPARTVWIPRHCYAEFYLVDDDGEGHWFPCQVAGNREFGGISETAPILAKGDSFRDPDNPREKRRFPAEILTAESGSPKVQTVRKPVSP